MGLHPAAGDFCPIDAFCSPCCPGPHRRQVSRALQGATRDPWGHRVLLVSRARIHDGGDLPDSEVRLLSRRSRLFELDRHHHPPHLIGNRESGGRHGIERPHARLRRQPRDPRARRVLPFRPAGASWKDARTAPCPSCPDLAAADCTVGFLPGHSFPERARPPLPIPRRNRAVGVGSERRAVGERRRAHPHPVDLDGLHDGPRGHGRAVHRCRTAVSRERPFVETGQWLVGAC